MQLVALIENQFRKKALPQVQSGDTVRVHHLIKEGGKQRVQIFEGVIIRTSRLGELTASITVRRIASNVGVEKTYLLHSPNVPKIEVVRRTKVRRNYLTYLRARRGKSARLKEMAFDKLLANVQEEEIVPVPAAESDLDAEITEIETGDVKADEEQPLEAVIKEEEKAAGADEANADADTAADDENREPEEAQAGVDKADDEDTKNQE